MKQIDAPTVADAINRLIVAHVINSLDDVVRTYNDLEIALNGTDAPIADTTVARKCTCAADIRPTSSTHWQTKDCCVVNTGKTYALWYCDGITGEIFRVNGRVTWEGRLTEIADLDAATIDISELYYWRVNCLKDQFAAYDSNLTAPIIAVDPRHEYTDNAEIETETEAEYD